MKEVIKKFSYAVAKDISELTAADALLVAKARAATKKAYAPYSRFQVSCVAKLANGKTVAGTNQENASYPVGICAERAMLATIGTQYPDVAIETLAVSYHAAGGASNHPISPCGMCRQALSEYEDRTGRHMRIILSGMEGSIYIIHAAKDLLPLAFSEGDLA